MNIIFKWIKKVMRLVYTWHVKRCACSYGNNLTVNYYTSVTKYTRLGSNCNFNGCRILGKGDVTIGNNFHSGRNVQMITSFHNYDAGSEIPYDKTNIDKDIMIGDQVWLGNNVIILGGVNIDEGAIIQAA